MANIELTEEQKLAADIGDQNARLHLLIIDRDESGYERAYFADAISDTKNEIVKLVNKTAEYVGEEVKEIKSYESVCKSTDFISWFTKNINEVRAIAEAAQDDGGQENKGENYEV